MPEEVNARIELSLLSHYFSDQMEVLRLMLLSNLELRSVSEDFCLAHRALKRFESQNRSQGDCSVEVSDYQVMIAELDNELRNILNKAVLSHPDSNFDSR